MPCRWQYLALLDAVPLVFIWDGENLVGQWQERVPKLIAAYQAFRGTMAAKAVICKPGRSRNQRLRNEPGWSKFTRRQITRIQLPLTGASAA